MRVRPVKRAERHWFRDRWPQLSAQRDWPAGSSFPWTTRLQLVLNKTKTTWPIYTWAMRCHNLWTWARAGSRMGMSDNAREGTMSTAGRVLAVVLASTGLALAGSAPATADFGGRPFSIQLTGAAEVNSQGVPNQGDPDGSGTAHLWINPGKSRVCWSIEVTRVDPITAAHIHIGPSTAPGPVVVPLNPYNEGCAAVTRELALALIRDPGSYYVNVHNGPYPAGALRGQLHK